MNKRQARAISYCKVSFLLRWEDMFKLWYRAHFDNVLL